MEFVLLKHEAYMDQQKELFTSPPSETKNMAQLRQEWEASQLMTTNPKSFSEWLVYMTRSTTSYRVQPRSFVGCTERTDGKVLSACVPNEPRAVHFSPYNFKVY